MNGSNNVELGQLLESNIDLSNNFLPGIASLISSPASTGKLNSNGGYGLVTYYPSAPYMMSANTVWLEPNLTKAPMNNLNFRKALAYGINPAQIVSVIYDNLVDAANPTGLLPNLDPFIAKSVKQYEFSYNPTKAKAFLKASGYKGAKITIEDPVGWTDWNSATDVIVQQLKAIGINAVSLFPTYDARTANLTNGTYDLALDNNAGPSSNPWSYFDRVFQLPILPKQSAQLNWERDTNQGSVGASPEDRHDPAEQTRRQPTRSTRNSRRSSCRHCRKSRSGTTGRGRSTKPRIGRTGRFRPIRTTGTPPSCGVAG